MRLLTLLCACVLSQSSPPWERFRWAEEGFRLYVGKQYAQAAAAYRSAIKAGDHTAYTQYSLACSLALSGQTGDALNALDSAIKAGFDDAAGMERDDDLRSLRSDKRWPSLVEACRKRHEIRAQRMADPKRARINVDNLRRFWHAYEEANKVDASARADVYDRLYFRDADGPLSFMLQNAGMTPTKMAKIVAAKAQYFAFLEKHQQDLAAQAKDLREEFVRFKRIYPEAQFPDTYVMIGGFNSGGLSSGEGLLVGAEMFGKYPDTPWQELGDWEKRIEAPPVDFIPLAVHECAHFQQTSFSPQTLLTQVLHEGAADFISYLVTGRMLERNRNLHLWANPREREIWLQFRKEMDNPSTSGWLYAGPKPGWPEDVGYWLGFKICESYYGRAEDKAMAVKDILTMTDAKAFLAASQYADKFGDAPR